ncbi:hypothetical protein AVEN_41294-1 [Araneus ventricosus]|uniref:Uncharacterized protein n=1 Tax=Araneus ventricosus TaxID=182803 RepID=A0A4Y2M9I6_ARAVE|nr:hypothetical protein AVEN_41294-1 [Araneus ventricosus]
MGESVYVGDGHDPQWVSRWVMVSTSLLWFGWRGRWRSSGKVYARGRSRGIYRLERCADRVISYLYIQGHKNYGFFSCTRRGNVLTNFHERRLVVPKGKETKTIGMKDIMFYDVRHKTLKDHLENLARHRRKGNGSIGRNERRVFPDLEH